MPSRRVSIESTSSATRAWFFIVSAPMTAHCSAVDSSMRVKLEACSFVTVMGPFCPRTVASGERGEDVAGRERPVVVDRTLAHRAAEGERGDEVDGGQQLAELSRRREVLLLVGDPH